MGKWNWYQMHGNGRKLTLDKMAVLNILLKIKRENNVIFLKHSKNLEF